MKRYLFASNFGKTLTSNDTGYVVSELLGIATEEFERKIKGPLGCVWPPSAARTKMWTICSTVSPCRGPSGSPRSARERVFVSA